MGVIRLCLDYGGQVEARFDDPVAGRVGAGKKAEDRRLEAGGNSRFHNRDERAQSSPYSLRSLAHIIHVLRRERAQGASDQRLAEEGRMAAC